MKIAYLINTYSPIFHRYIATEIRELERQGFEVSRFSIRSGVRTDCDPAEAVEDASEDEASNVVAQGPEAAGPGQQDADSAPLQTAADPADEP